MILQVGERAWRGRAIDCPVAVDPRRLAAAVRDAGSHPGPPSVEIDAPSPTPVHSHVGCITPTMGLRVKTALAKAGRTRGLTTPVDDRIAALEREVADADVPADDRRSARRRVATAGTDIDRLRERVAEERGRRAVGVADDADAPAAMESTAAALAEAETSAIAARQALDRERSVARETRDRLDERRRRAEALANARRAARAWLVEASTPTYRRALAAVPGTVPADAPFDASPVTAALAIVRLARTAAPVVLACDRFADASAAAACLRSPVIRVRP